MIQALLFNRVKTEDGAMEITFKITSLYQQEELRQLKLNEKYKLVINEIKNNRSINQNNLMWELIHQISIKRNGERTTSSNDWDIYLECLEEAGAKYEIIAILPEAESMIKNQFRAVKVLNQFEHKGKTFSQLKVFYGSSKMDTKEMNKLLELVFDKAEQEGIDTSIYEINNAR